MKVFCLITGLGPGGAERSLAEMLPYFLASGIQPVVITLTRRQHGVQSLVERGGVDVRVLEGSRWNQLWQLRRLIKAEQPNLIHTSIFGADILGRVASAGTGVPVLSSLVNASYEPVRLMDPNVSRFKLRILRWIDSWSAWLFNSHFHAVTHAVKDAAVDRLALPGEKITVIERGRDRQRLGSPSPERKLKVRKALGLSHDDIVLVNVGRQEYQKGQRYLLQAMPRVLDSSPDAKLLIAGREGNSTEELNRMVRDLRLESSVRFLGHRDDVPDLLASADLFVFPSLYEGIGGSIIEAMALGLPIVATDLRALREVVQEGTNALLTDAASGESVASAVMELLSDRCRMRSFGERSAELYDKHFTIERCAFRMIDLYQRVAKTAIGHPVELQNTRLPNYSKI